MKRIIQSPIVKVSPARKAQILKAIKLAKAKRLANNTAKKVQSVKA